MLVLRFAVIFLTVKLSANVITPRIDLESTFGPLFPARMQTWDAVGEYTENGPTDDSLIVIRDRIQWMPKIHDWCNRGGVERFTVRSSAAFSTVFQQIL